jgi:hypothetical protein
MSVAKLAQGAADSRPEGKELTFGAKGFENESAMMDDDGEMRVV